MKPKKFNKKLSFSKSTIANLNYKESNDVRGGSGLYTKCPDFDTCPDTQCGGTCNTCTCNTCPQTCGDTCWHAGTACPI